MILKFRINYIVIIRMSSQNQEIKTRCITTIKKLDTINIFSYVVHVDVGDKGLGSVID